MDTILTRPLQTRGSARDCFGRRRAERHCRHCRLVQSSMHTARRSAHTAASLLEIRKPGPWRCLAGQARSLLLQVLLVPLPCCCLQRLTHAFRVPDLGRTKIIGGRGTHEFRVARRVNHVTHAFESSKALARKARATQKVVSGHHRVNCYITSSSSESKFEDSEAHG